MAACAVAEPMGVQNVGLHECHNSKECFAEWLHGQHRHFEEYLGAEHWALQASESTSQVADESNFSYGYVPVMCYVPVMMPEQSWTATSHESTWSAEEPAATVADPATPTSQAKRAAVPKKKPPVWGTKKKSTKPNASNNNTTVKIENLPVDCTTSMVVEMLDAARLFGKYDFVYAPTDFKSHSSFGYCFVNFTSHKAAVLAMDMLDGWTCETWSEHKEELEVCWSEPHQGLNVHIKRYQNSPVMHPSVPDQYRPQIFKNGLEQPFPAPTRSIKLPRLRR